MEWWLVAAATSLVVTVVYVGIAVLMRPLARHGWLQSNPLATATSLIS